MSTCDASPTLRIQGLQQIEERDGVKPLLDREGLVFFNCIYKPVWPIGILCV